MPESNAAAMNYERMLDELADAYPGLKEKALDLKGDMLELIPEDEAAPEQAPDVSLELDMGDEEDVSL